MKTEEKIIGNENYMEEVVKKSSMAAEDSFDYMKLVTDEPGLIPCTFSESLEEVIFTYNLTGLRSLKEMDKEAEEKKWQFLVNFARLYKVYEQYRINLDEKNIFYDENMMPYVKTRDLYGREHKAEAGEFLYVYQCIAGGLLSKKYRVSQVLESGLEILKKDKKVQKLIQADDMEKFIEVLKRNRDEYHAWKEQKIREVSRRAYTVWKVIAVTMVLVGLVTGGFSVYFGAFAIPQQKALVMANERYIQKDYVGCIDSVKNMETLDMDVHTKYILAVSYASTESFKQEEISNIVSRLSINSNEKELEYWISLGRLDVKQAENLALALSDDKLLIYAYMKEIDLLENESNIDGEEKKSRLDTLNNEIKTLGEKYNTEEK